jgi:hypothetical protein
MHLLAAIAEEHHERAELFMPAWSFPLIAAIAFILMAAITHSYRDVANRHSDKVGDSPADHGHGHGAH